MQIEPEKLLAKDHRAKIYGYVFSWIELRLLA